jgi:hypothetical protein
MNTATLDQDEQQQIDAIRARKAKERERQEQLNRLQKQVNEAQDRLSRAEDFNSFAAQRITQLQAIQLELCGKERTVTNVDPTAQLLDSYQTILVLRSAITDWPRLKQHLQGQVDVASQRLADFQRS